MFGFWFSLSTKHLHAIVIFLIPPSWFTDSSFSLLESHYRCVRLHDESRMSVLFDYSKVLIPISVSAFDAIVFTFFSFAALTTVARVYLWTFVFRCGVLDNVFVLIGTVSHISGWLLIYSRSLIIFQASNLGCYVTWTFRGRWNKQIGRDCPSSRSFRNTELRVSYALQPSLPIWCNCKSGLPLSTSVCLTCSFMVRVLANVAYIEW